MKAPTRSLRSTRACNRAQVTVVLPQPLLVPASSTRRCSGGAYPALAAAVEARFGGRVRPLGYLPELPSCRLGRAYSSG